MLFSVIVPTFNRACFLSRALESVAAQEFRDYETIVVDDGSTDGTREYLETLGPGIIRLSQSNQGPGSARNLGARNARGEYFAFLDDDDLWFPWTLSCFAELISQFRHPSILRAKVVEFTDTSELQNVMESAARARFYPDYFASHPDNRFVGAGMSVLRRDVFLGSRGYTDRIRNSEDHDLVMRLGESPGFVQISEPATLAYRRHPEGITSDAMRSFEGARYLVEQEKSGHYPGGRTRARDRRTIISQRTRPVTFALAKQGLLKEAWALFGATLAWNLLLGRWRYLGGFPIRSIWTRISTR